jgi:hypothetical protein
MDSQQAKRVLALYRADLADPNDTLMAEALEQIQRDPELAAWFERQSATNQAIRAKLKAIPVPADLHRRILANHTARGRIIPFPRPALVGLAAAAAVVAAFFIWQTMQTEPTGTFDRYVEHFARGVQRPVTYFPPMEFVSTNQLELRAWFQTRSASTNFVLPAGLEKLGGEAAAVVSWQTHKVQSLCLTNVAGGSKVWAFITENANFPKAPAPGKKPGLKQIGKMMTASWTAGDKVYLIVAAGNEDTMLDYLR